MKDVFLSGARGCFYLTKQVLDYTKNGYYIVKWETSGNMSYLTMRKK